MSGERIDVLAVMDRSIEILHGNAWGEDRDDLQQARAAVAELIERERVMREALAEIIAINDESDGVFRKRGGTRRGLSIVTARAALARVQGEGA